MAERTPTLRAAVPRLAAALVALALMPSVAVAAASGTVPALPATTPTSPAPAATSPAKTAAAAHTETVIQTATLTTTTTATTTTSKTATATTTAAPKPRPKHVVAGPSPRAAPLPTSLTGWLSPTGRFPQRAVVVESPAGTAISSGQLTVTENGRAIATSATASGADVLTKPGAHDFGVELALTDTASTAGATLRDEIAAAHTLAAHRPPQLALGVLRFSAVPQLLAPITTSATALSDDLSQDPSPGAGAGAGITAAGLQAVTQVVAGDVAVGVVVVVSDGVGVSGSGSAVAAAAAAAHVSVVTIGLRDASSTPASLQALSRWAPGAFLLAAPARLGGALVSTIAKVAHPYSVVRYHSSAPAGTTVSVSVHAGSVPGAVTADYRVAGSAAPPRPRLVHRHHASATSAASAALHGSTPLSPTPSFGDGAIPALASGTGFWHSGAAVLVIALLSGLLIGTMVMLLLRRPNRHAVRTRVGSYIPSEYGPGVVEAHEEEKRRSGLLGLLERGTWWPQFVEAVEVSRNAKSPSFLMKRAGLIALLAAVLLALVSHIVALALIPILAFPLVERWWVMRQATKQREKFADTLPSYMADIASAIRVGRSLVSAVGAVADSANEPTRSELERAVTDEALGRPLDESLTAVGQRMHSSDMDQFALVAELNRRSGANVAEALERVAEGARERADLRREMRALTSQSKMSSSVLTGMPFVLLLALSVIAPEYAHPLFHTMWGVISLCFAATFIVIGWKVMKKITNVGV